MISKEEIGPTKKYIKLLWKHLELMLIMHLNYYNIYRVC